MSADLEVAESLADRYGLPVLTCRLHTPSGGEPADDVAVALTFRLGYELLAPPMVMTTAEMRLPPTLEAVANATGVLGVRVPDWVADELRAALAYVDPGDPLFLELGSPVGHLAAVPWENLLHPILRRPVVRLPSSPVRPIITRTGIDVAICAVEGRRDAPYDLSELVRMVVEHAARALGAETTIHLFMRDPGRRREAESLPAPGARLRVHDPAEMAGGLDPEPALSAESRSTGIPGQLDNPWLRWMLEAVHPAPIDLVHFIAPGHLSTAYGALDLGPAPLDELGERSVRTVTAGQLVSFLNRAGTWGAAFTLPARRAWPAGLRFIAHRVTQLCPVPVLIHVPHHRDPDAPGELVDAYRLLFTDEPVQMLPANPALNVYAHPARVPRQSATPSDTEAFQWEINRYVAERTLEGTSSESLLVSGQAPHWLAANQRSLERWAAAAVDLTLGPQADATTARGVADALSFVSGLFDDPHRGSER